MAKQLFSLGKKEFYLLRPDTMNEVVYIDWTLYDDLSHPMRICAFETRGVGGSARALLKYNSYSDIDIVMIEKGVNERVDPYLDGAMYYAYFTSALFITQVFEEIPGKKCIELWHGFTIKALWNATFSDYERSGFEYMTKNMDITREAICSYSRLYNIFFGFCAKIDQAKFHITGIPRNDLLILSDAEANMRKVFGDIEKKHIIFYLPTHRDYYDNEIDESKVDGHIFFWPDFNFDDFNDFLNENNILLITKFHYYELERFTARESENVKYLCDKALAEKDVYLYELLGATDLLITDYSSVSVDFLLLDRPIVYAVRDLDEYTATRGLMTEPFDAWAPGETTRDYKGLKSAIYNALFDEDMYKDKREQMQRIMHKYNDAQSTKRVLELARSILSDC
jgi:CDP-glycerol glycerophosphotransferase (TagB/SpsB family)